MEVIGREPGPMFGAMHLGIADDGQRARREQAAQIAIALFADTAELVLAPARVLLRHEPDPGRKIPPRSEISPCSCNSTCEMSVRGSRSPCFDAGSGAARGQPKM